MTDFWQRVESCKHENETGYCRYFSCGTPLCEGIEFHCRDCGVYISECECMSGDGMSGWPRSRVIKHHKGTQ